jgi:hypothetical protein
LPPPFDIDSVEMERNAFVDFLAFIGQALSANQELSEIAQLHDVISEVVNPIDSPVAKITLQALCTKMHNQGYVYASFYNPESPLEKMFCRPTYVGVKPEGDMYFSALCEAVDCESEEFVPEWYEFIKEEEIERIFRESATRDLVFAKFDMFNILNSNKSKMFWLTR